MVRFTTGDMFAIPADIRVNTVNCVGVMGAGVALAFKQRFPEMFREYRRQCELGLVRPGELHVWKSLGGDWIINFPTKRHWREKSRYEDIESGLTALRKYLVKQGHVRVTLPALGSGHGGLDWTKVSPMIQEHLEGLEAEIIVFDPADSRAIDGVGTAGSRAAGISSLLKSNGFPKALNDLGCEEIYYQGDATILTNADLTIALSLKPTEREQAAAIECISELAKHHLTLCLVLGTATATKLVLTALESGAKVAAWVPQGLHRYRLPKVLQVDSTAAHLLLLSLAKPQQGWNPQFAYRSTIASLLTSKVAFVTDPEPLWLDRLNKEHTARFGAPMFYIRYQSSEPRLEEQLNRLSARPIGRRSSDGRPNLRPVFEALALPVPQESSRAVPLEQPEEQTMVHERPVEPFAQPLTQAGLQQIGSVRTQYPKRLIEVDLPIKRISAHSRREKSILHGHISTLHIWWARRPLAACRAVICAALWPDPADELCPDSFGDTARELMLEWATDHLALLGEESSARFIEIRNDPSKLDDNIVLRQALLDFIADFSNWDNSTVTEYLDTSRALTQSAHEALGGAPGTRPLVVDPFAGGGSIPLEALRVGADAFASDLNPVAVLLNKVVLEYIPKYGQHLADEVRKCGEWIRREAEKELAEFYPKDADGATPIAYLWARTVLSEAPTKDQLPIQIPLLRSLWLSKRRGFQRAVRWVRDDKGKVKTFVGEISLRGQKVKVRKPVLEIFSPTAASQVEAGTSKAGSATCPITGFTTPAARVKEQLKQQRGGAQHSRLYAVYVQRADGREFRIATKTDYDGFQAATENARKLLQEDPGAFPTEPINPIRPYNNTRGLSAVTRIGCASFADLYNWRQALSNLRFCDILRKLGKGDLTLEPEFLKAVQTVLAFAVNRGVSQNTSMSRWDASRLTIKGAFSKQALAVVWDFAEASPFSGGSATWDGAIEWVMKFIESNSALDTPGTALRASATNIPLPSDSAAALVTDPPYFAAIPYADLSDFFYVWLRRGLGNVYPELFCTELTEKSDELIVTNAQSSRSGRLKDDSFFREGMADALKSARDVVQPEGIGIVVYAEGTTAGWEAIIRAIIDSHWVVTSSWPIDTEMVNRTQAQGSASLQSSIHIVCRPRENLTGSARTEEIGDWRDVLQELPRRIHDWMPRLAAEGVVGADAIFACLGPALEIFSRYSRVEKASGAQIVLEEYLEEVWGAVAREAMRLIFEDADATGFEEDARLTAIWFWVMKAAMNGNGTNGLVANGEDGEGEAEAAAKKTPQGFSMEYDAARKLAQGLGVDLQRLSGLGGIVLIKGSIVMLNRVAERERYLLSDQLTLFGLSTARAKSRSRHEKPPMVKLKSVEQRSDLVVPAIVQAYDPSEPFLPGLKPPDDLRSTLERLVDNGSTVLDRLHQAMLLFARSQTALLRPFIVETRMASDERFWRLAQALSALYPRNTDEKRWVDGVLAKKKGLGF